MGEMKDTLLCGIISVGFLQGSQNSIARPSDKKSSMKIKEVRMARSSILRRVAKF